ncbi:PREDICTED: kin of IRRE-like protein 3 [Branchiostoma belcheri]|uniref:Kin of IRRE-like protein 3 n=1 Tax=Branchiostoma belcheri TaxID=7741 RepID=A0A6P4YXI9_BRABE|nr:PREDICTED: kin of IRRE-like protein 3 [Branchiostoma belcheri]
MASRGSVGLRCVLVLFCRIAPLASGASYRVRPQSTAVLHGQTAVLRCAFDKMGPKDMVIWDGPPNQRVISYGTNVLPVYTRHRVVGDTSRGEFNLEIRDIKLEDDGKYSCYTDPMAAADAILTVVVPMPNPPQISGGELSLTSGDQLSLTCRASGAHPSPRLTWLNGTEPFQSSGVSSGEAQSLELFLARVTKWDHGANFTCRADQGFPQLARPKASSRILRVKYPPAVSVPSPSVHVREGEPASLSCMVDSNPKATVTWRKVGEVLPSLNIIRDHVLQLPKVTRKDGGLYHCEADNGVRPVGLGSVTMQVYYPPVIEATMGDQVTMLYGQDDQSLRCLADGNPKPHIRWRRKDTSLYWDNPLRFHRVRYDVQGTYQCVAASDGFQQVTKDVYVDVVGKPSIQTDASAAAAQGTLARLHCEILGDPLPGRVTWSWRNKQGAENVLMATDAGLSIIEKPVDDGTSSTLLLKDVGKSQEGTYICQAANMFGEARREIHLEVTGSDQPLVVLSVCGAAAVLVLLAAVCVCWAVRTRRVCGNKRKAGPPPLPSDRSLADVPSARSLSALPKPGKRLGHGTNDSGVEDLELQELDGTLDGTLKPRPPPRGDKHWAHVGLSYSGLAHAHATTLPPYTTVERHRPDGEDIRACAREDIPEEAGLSSDEFITIEAPPEPPPKMQRGRWKTTAPPGGAAVRCSLHEAENELNEIQQADSI